MIARGLADIFTRVIFGPVSSSRCGTNNREVREAWVKRSLQSIRPGTRILDAGAGESQYGQFCGHLNYVSQDFAQYDGAGNRKGLQTGSWDQNRLDIVCDITAIPEPKESFGAIMCIEVLEHLPRPEQAIREFSRLLKPGGTLLITAPFCSITHFAPYYFASGFSEYFYRELLALHGFTLLNIEKNGNYFAYLGQEIRRISSMAQRYSPNSPLHGRRKRYLRVLATSALLEWLAELEERDEGSSEVLCFGLHVLAEKGR